MNPQVALGILALVEADQAVTQKSLAAELGVAVGLVNLYLKRCVKKGLVKVRQAPPNRYFYYLTPHGFLEKSRLTADYLSSSLSYFRNARQQYADILEACDKRGLSRVLLCGHSELAEIAVLSAAERGIRLTALVDAGLDQDNFLGLPVVSGLDAAPPADCAVVTAMEGAQGIHDQASARFGADRVMAPTFLHINSRASNGED
jgi:DNA-binding MarR family transcriptional regulator